MNKEFMNIKEALQAVVVASTPSDMLSNMIVQHTIGGLTVPALVLGSASDMRELGNNLGELARKGIIVHTHSSLY